MKRGFYGISFCIILMTFLSFGNLFNSNCSAISFSAQVISIQISFNNEIFMYNTAHQQVSNFNDVKKAQHYNRWGNHTDRGVLGLKLLKMGMDTDTILDYIFCDAKDEFNSFCDRVNCPPQDAELKFHPNNASPFTIIKEKVGYKLNKYELLSNIFTELLITPNVNVVAKPQELLPNKNAEQLKPYINILSSFSTKFDNSNMSRTNNIKTAINQFNGMVLRAGVEYSFNKITGKRTQNNGYQEAKIIVDKKYVEGVGGGVCQVSTTLYNALLLAGLEIREVHSHSLVPSYIKMGFDAMVNYGTSDLVWYNNSGDDLFIKTYVLNNEVGVVIYGKPNNRNQTFERLVEIEETITPDNEEIVIDEKGEHRDKVVYKDESFYLAFAKNGYKVRAILEIYENQKLVDRKLLRRVTYQSARAVKVFGAKNREEHEFIHILDNIKF